MTLGHLNPLFLFLYNKNTDNYNCEGLQEDSNTHLTLADYYSSVPAFWEHSLKYQYGIVKM